MIAPGIEAASVLIVEDDEATAELERRALERSGRRVDIVATVRAAREALGRNRYRIIVLDYRLPDGEAWPVLELAQSIVPRIPVIVATGMGDERVAVEVLRRGGADYVMKAEGFWEQLPISVDRVLRTAEFEETNRRLATIVESSDDAMINEDLDGTILSWNTGAARIFGYEAEEIIGHSIKLLAPPWPGSGGTRNTRPTPPRRNHPANGDGPNAEGRVARRSLHDRIPNL